MSCHEPMLLMDVRKRMRACQHPNVVQLLDVHHDSNCVLRKQIRATVGQLSGGRILGVLVMFRYHALIEALLISTPPLCDLLCDLCVALFAFIKAKTPRMM